MVSNLAAAAAALLAANHSTATAAQLASKYFSFSNYHYYSVIFVCCLVQCIGKGEVNSCSNSLKKSHRVVVRGAAQNRQSEWLETQHWSNNNNNKNWDINIHARQKNKSLLYKLHRACCTFILFCYCCIEVHGSQVYASWCCGARCPLKVFTKWNRNFNRQKKGKLSKAWLSIPHRSCRILVEFLAFGAWTFWNFRFQKTFSRVFYYWTIGPIKSDEVF